MVVALFSRIGIIALASFVCLFCRDQAAAAQPPSYRCEAPNGVDARMEACAARWEAANIRAHVVLTDKLSVSTIDCLNGYAAALDHAAQQMMVTNKHVDTMTPHCDLVKTFTTSSDDALVQICPGKVWSYDNVGLVSCAFRRPSTAATQTAPEPGLHVEYVVEVNKYGKIVIIKDARYSGFPFFDRETRANVIAMTITQSDNTTTTGLYNISYDLDPKTSKVTRMVALVSLGGDWSDMDQSDAVRKSPWNDSPPRRKALSLTTHP
jgi:hypothetical protein